MDDLINLVVPTDDYDGTNCLDAADSLRMNGDHVAETHQRRLNEAIRAILNQGNFALRKDFWGHIAALRIAAVLVSTLDASKPVADEVGKMLKEVTRFTKARFKKVALERDAKNLPLHFRCKLEYSAFLGAIVEASGRLDCSKFVDEWDAETFLEVMRDNNLFVRAHAAIGAPASIRIFPELAGDILQSGHDVAVAASPEEQATLAIALVNIANVNVALSAEAVSRIVQFSSGDMQSFAQICLRFLSHEWHFADSSDLGKELFPSLLSFWFASALPFLEFPSVLLGYDNMQRLLEFHKEEVVAQMFIADQTAQLK
jgi:hypothetical protein